MAKSLTKVRKALIIAVLVLATGCRQGQPAASPSPAPAPVAPPPQAHAEPPKPEAIVPAPCSLIGVVLDNSIPARPQSGISQADIVYEFPAEGGITRLLGFYCTQAPKVVGPVRSVRTFMLDVAREYHAVVAHSGQSESALVLIRQGRDPVINEFSQPGPFWRTRDRRMPNNLYTSVEALRKVIARPLKPAPAHWEVQTLEPESAPMSVTIPYGRGYDVEFTYDPNTTSYTRTVARRPSIDAVTGKQITVGSVIIQYARWWQAYESGILTARLDLVGSGSIVAFTEGRQIDGRWRRAGPQQPTIFTDEHGQPLRLQPGPVWVSIVPSDRPINVSP